MLKAGAAPGAPPAALLLAGMVGWALPAPLPKAPSHPKAPSPHNALTCDRVLAVRALGLFC